jgi:hypothetical protein
MDMGSSSGIAPIRQAVVSGNDIANDGDIEMSKDDEWSPDEPSGTEPFEQGDEANDDSEGLDPQFLEARELDPSLDPTLIADDKELEEAGAEFDDPESMAVLDGGMDDPDGIGGPGKRASGADDGWDLDAPDVSEANDSSSDLS